MSSTLFGTQKSRVHDTDVDSVGPKDSTWPKGKVYDMETVVTKTDMTTRPQASQTCYSVGLGSLLLTKRMGTTFTLSVADVPV